MSHPIQILFLAIFALLSAGIGYLLVAAVAGRLRRQRNYPTDEHKRKIAVLITTYKEDDVILETASKACSHDYPSSRFDVFIAADQLKPETIVQLQRLPARIHPLMFESGSKARSLNFLLNRLDINEYDIALVLDGDNIMLPGTLEKINTAFARGYRAVQAHRTAKNLNTTIAVLDALSEEVNNHLFRKAQRVLGLSSTTIGSGMAFEPFRLKEIYNKPGILDNPACDRVVDFEMMKQGVEVEYIDDALVLDEKVAVENVYRGQRRRWLESQLIHLRLFFSRREKVSRKTRDYWNKLFINLLPPRMLFLAIFAAISIVVLAGYLARTNVTGIAWPWWALLFAAYLLSILLSVPTGFYNLRTLKAILSLPLLVFSFIKAAFSLKPGRKEFVHTPKSYTGDPPQTDNGLHEDRQFPK